MKLQKTTLVKDKDITRNWHEMDASKFTLGRLATAAARILVGKHKVTYSNHQDQGDFVVIVNAEKVKFSETAKKVQGKLYHRYSGYSGGLRTETLAKKFEKNPESVILHAIRGMIDANRLRKPVLRRLHIVKGEKHSYPVKKK